MLAWGLLLPAVMGLRSWLPLGVLVVCWACGGEPRDASPWSSGTSAGQGGDGVGSTSGPGDDGLGDTGGTAALTHADDDHGGGEPPPDDDSGATSGPGDGGHTSSGGSTDGNATGAGDDGGPPPPDCPANCYCEPIDPDADIADLQGGYQPATWDDTLLEVLHRRWPAGEGLLTWARAEDAYFGAFTDTGTFGGLMDSVMTEVHEGTHGWDYHHASVNDFAYYLREDLTYHPSKVHGFDRSEIYGMVEGSSTDLYKDLYLVGTQGTYGFYELLDEMNCYINGMGGIAVVGEHIPFGISGRDGAVAFMYYLELYLRRARMQYPSLYEDLKADPEFVDLVQTQWLRMHFLLQYADDHPHIGIHDAEIRQLMYAPENQAEIEMFIDHELEASNCLP